MAREISDIEFEMFIMPFGKYKNWELKDIPAHYILWMLDQDYCPEVLRAYGELNEEELTDAVKSADLMYDY